MRTTASARLWRINGDAEEVALTEIPRAARVERVPFGFPSTTPAMERMEREGPDGSGSPLNLNDVVARQPPTTFFIALTSDALLDSGIHAGDVLVVNRTLRPHYGALTVVTLDAPDSPDVVDGALLVRHYCPDSAAIHLLPAHPYIAPISVRDRARCHVWGVVTGVVRRGRKRQP